MGTKVCSACKLEKPLSSYSKNKTRKDGYQHQCKCCTKAYKEKNKETLKAYDKAYKETHKEYFKEQTKTWRIVNKGAWNATRAKYRASKLKATPSWADLNKIKEFYECCHAFKLYTGEEYHVDHIVPLQGKTVCGLHCESNLQIIKMFENAAKRNYWWPDMP